MAIKMMFSLIQPTFWYKVPYHPLGEAGMILKKIEDELVDTEELIIAY